MAVNQPDRVSPADGIVLTPAQARSRRNRNIAIGLAIALFVVLIFIVTLAKLSAMSKPI